MNVKFSKLAVALAAAALSTVATQASAAASWNYTLNTTSSFAGVTQVTFDAPSAPLGTVSSYSVTDMINGTATYDKGAIYSTSINSITAKPVGSTGNFWSIGGVPVTQNGPGTVSFSGAAASGVAYYGFLYGSSDPYNDVTFTFQDASTLTINGSQVPSGTGNQGVSRYVNVFADSTNKITGVSFVSTTFYDSLGNLKTGNAFETDNHAYSVTAVPEPESYALMLAGLGLMGTIARRRNKSKAA